MGYDEGTAELDYRPMLGASPIRTVRVMSIRFWQ